MNSVLINCVIEQGSSSCQRLQGVYEPVPDGGKTLSRQGPCEALDPAPGVMPSSNYKSNHRAVGFDGNV